MMRTPCRTVELHHLPTGEIVEWRHTPESLGRHLSRAEEMAVEASEADDRYRAAVAERPGPRRASGDRQSVGPAAVPAEIDELFAPSPGPICSWCDFRRHCPEGQAAGPDRQPWDALAE
ncbi:recombinase RecB, partial [Nonomuraea sp. NPDC004297]